MKSERELERLIKNAKWQYAVLSVGVPIVLCIPLFSGCWFLFNGYWKPGLFLIGCALFFFLFNIVCRKADKKSIIRLEKELEELDKMKQELEEMKTLKEKIETK